MKNKLFIILFFCLIFSASSILITACQSKAVNETNSSSLSSETAASLSDKNKDKQLENVIPQSSDKSDSEVSSTNSTDKSASANNSVVTPSVSRGGSITPAVSQSTNKVTAQSNPAAANHSSKSNAVKSSTSKPELLDWWKDAQYVFPRGASAVVQDYYTGKTFKIVRTMGTNHADCEAASKADTDIIKSIWGGFSWARRPVIVIINGRRLAASMSAMPHAGIDALPAYQTVDNRSDGYGTGENLDVIKGNGMDGHFDIHFLNSTRHKDNQIDPQHQAMIKIAAGL